jgi:4-oxalocrotonate tautomerase
MPYIAIEGPRISDIGKKRDLVTDLTKAAAKCYGLPEEAIIVVIRETLPENVGVGGKLISDRHPHG